MGNRVGPRPRRIPTAVNATSIILIVCGWLAFLTPARFVGGDKAAARFFAIGVMVGIGVAVGGVKAGVRLEQERLGKQGTGTPLSSMMKRAALIFSSLSLIDGFLLASIRQAGIFLLATLVGLSAIWIPAAVAWRVRPEAGPLRWVVSVAWRATFFALAVTALASLVCPLFLQADVRSPLAAGAWIGVGSTAFLLTVTAWAATRFRPRTAVLISGALCGAGFCVLAIMK
jgi:hypothetical protein